MKKNAQIHLLIESEVVDKIKKEAEEKNVSWSEICRQKLRQNNQLNIIEIRLEEIEKILNTKLNFNGRSKW